MGFNPLRQKLLAQATAKEREDLLGRANPLYTGKSGLDGMKKRWGLSTENLADIYHRAVVLRENKDGIAERYGVSLSILYKCLRLMGWVPYQE